MKPIRHRSFFVNVLRSCYLFGIVLFVAILLTLPGTGFSQGQDNAPLVLSVSQDGVQRATIRMESYVFAPSKLQVSTGTPVELTLVNESFLVPHNFILDNPQTGTHVEQEIEWDEEATIQFTLPQPDIYQFYCDKQLLFMPSHREEGMEGSIEAK